MKIYASFWNADVCLSRNVVSGLVGVRFRRVWVRSTAACAAASLEDIIDKVSVAGGNP